MPLEGAGLTMSSPVWLLGPNKTTPWSGRRSMMILNVNHKFARANQEKVSENMLYCIEFQSLLKESTDHNAQELGYERKTCG